MLASATNERSAQPQRICDLCVDMLGMSGAGISLMTNTENHGVVVATDSIAEEIERLQLTLGEGPGYDAASGRMPILVPDLMDPQDLAVERWPVFLHSAREAGVAAVFAFPMLVGAVSVGVLDLYRRSPGDLAEGQLPAALMAADAAALAVLELDVELAPPTAPQDGASGESFYNPLLHQATGMIMVQLEVGTQEAFLALRARAFATGRPLAAVAVDVVARRMRLSKEDT